MKYVLILWTITIHTIIFSSPVSVVCGGTGFIAATAYAVICAGTSSPGSFQPLSSPGSSGQALVSGGAASLPAFGTLPISGGGTGAPSLSTGVIQSNGSVLSSLGIGSANQVLVNSSGTVNWAFSGILQIATASTFARIATTVTIPNDDTIPQITEGTSILSLAFTPKSASSTLIILFSTSGTPTSSASPAIAALFVAIHP
ncbi:hypothetical protein KAZ82_00675 [Candidatus Babeliales bacterium]|nr:hypothetical protein [Candidatus Babeliales bacterium]